MREPSTGAASVLPPDWGDGYMGVHIPMVIYFICTDYTVIRQFNMMYSSQCQEQTCDGDIIDLEQVLGSGVSHVPGDPDAQAG